MFHNRSVIALVPIKAHSARVPGKNTRNFNGQPLFHHILSTLRQVPGIDRIVVDTDSEEIARAVAGFGPQYAVLERPPHLCGDTVSVNRLIANDMKQVPADIYLQTHVTNPLLKAATIHQAVTEFLQGEAAGHDSLFSVNRFQTRLYDHVGAAINHDPATLIPTQDLPPVYEENSLLYVFTPVSFAKHQTRIGDRPKLFTTPKMESIDIDEEFHFRLAELIAMYSAK